MILVVDVGNSHTVLGLMSGDDVVHSFRVSTVERTTDELGALLLQLFALRGVQASAVEGVILSSVVPAVLYTIDKACRRYLNHTPLVVGRRLKTGMRVRTDNPREIGSDRIVNAVSGFRTYGGPLIIVDFRAATTVDCVDAAGDYVGGAIAPGFKTAEQALARGTAKLPRVEVAMPQQAIGKNTVASIQSGLVYGYAGLVDALVRRCRSELDPSARVVATGGMATLFAEVCEHLDEVDPWLTLRGLSHLYTKNAT